MNYHSLIMKLALVSVFMLCSTVMVHAQGVVTDVSVNTDTSYLQTRVCPVTVVFNGSITMDEPGTVTYRIVRSDGATGPVQTLDFLKAGTQSVSETWTLGDASALPNYEGWIAIQVLTPNAVESNHASAAFLMTCNAEPPPAQPQRARFRVISTGFSSIHETRDNILELDGSGDEIYQAPFVVEVERSGPTVWSIGAFGPVFRNIHTGTSFPTATPTVVTSPPVGYGFPGVLYEGELVEGEKAVAIAPTLWEWDGPVDPSVDQLGTFWGAASAASNMIASAAIPIMTGPFPARYAGLHTSLDGLITVPIAREGDLDRPVGIVLTQGGAAFTPPFLLLTYEGAMAAVASSGFSGDLYAIQYTDPESHQGDYELFLKVEQVP